MMDIVNKKIDRSRLYVWNRCFLNQELSVDLERGESGYQRLSVTILIATDEPLIIHRVGESQRNVQGVVIGPNVARINTSARGKDLLVLDAFITTQEYKQLMNYLDGNEYKFLSSNELSNILTLCRTSFYQDLNAEQAKELFEAVISNFCEPLNSDDSIDPRIQGILEIIEERHMDELSVSALAAEAALSESRLRALFKKTMHCSLAQYIRSVKFWDCVPLLAQGKSFTEAAHEIGFYDLAHFSRTANEFLGASPHNLLKNVDLFIDIN